MKNNRNPWWWIPSLYISEGLPNVLVMTVAVVMYMQMGMSDTEIAVYTGILGLPWMIKPLWSPFVDLFATKRWWVLAMQLLLGLALVGVAFTMNAPFWFKGTMSFFLLMSFASATHDIAADGYYMLELDDHDQVWFVGIRNTFYRLAVIFGNGALIPIAGILQERLDNKIAYSWSLVFFALAGLFIALFLYHSVAMPKAEKDKRHATNAGEIFNGIIKALVTFFTKLPPREMVAPMLFLLFYRFSEALMLKMSVTFLMRSKAEGGLGMSMEDFGIASGTIGVIGLTLGGIVGGMLAGKDGFKKWLWPMVFAITMPDIVYVYLSYAMPDSLSVISVCLFIEQFGYGFGFTALTLYMLYFSKGNYQTTHYSFCTAISYIGLMLPGMVSGYLKDLMGYQAFFILVMFLCSITFVVTALIKVDPEFGKKNQ